MASMTVGAPSPAPLEAAVPRSPHGSGQSHGQGQGGLFRLAVIIDAEAVQRRIRQSLDQLTGRQKGRHPSGMPIDAARQGRTALDLRLDSVEEISPRSMRRDIAVEDHGDDDLR